jgi:hypothetical protein
MNATHILFVAWPKGYEKIAEARAWKKIGNAQKAKNGTRKFAAVVYQKGARSETLRKMQTGQIYILGHGDSGTGHIADVEQGGDGLTANVVCDRLVESGLSTSFSGKIKCFTCYSAAGAHGKLSFAARLAVGMRSRGYCHCGYVGYERAIVAAYEDLGLGSTSKHYAEFIGGRYVEQGRTSLRQRQIP